MIMPTYLFRRVRFQTLASVGLLVLVGAACSSDSGTKGAASLVVTATDTTCEIDQKTFESGAINVEAKNDGNKVTEVYVYGDDDRVMGEVENIGPDTSRDFTVELGAGSYEVACKPGQDGDGIRAPFKVTGKADEQSIDRSISFKADEYAFDQLQELEAKVGETVEFRMYNAGREDHEFEVLLGGSRVGEVGPTPSDETGVAVISFDKPGTYKYICDIDDHKSRGMEGTFIVK